MKKATKSQEERLPLLDLLLCCGDDVCDEIVAVLKETNRLDITFAVYVRIFGLYYFRYHRDVDRTSLRKLLKDILHEATTLYDRWPTMATCDKRKIAENLIGKTVVGDHQIDITFS